jgi:hypothetical protein
LSLVWTISVVSVPSGLAKVRLRAVRSSGSSVWTRGTTTAGGIGRSWTLGSPTGGRPPPEDGTTIGAGATSGTGEELGFGDPLGAALELGFGAVVDSGRVVGAALGRTLGSVAATGEADRAVELRTVAKATSRPARRRAIIQRAKDAREGLFEALMRCAELRTHARKATPRTRVPPCPQVRCVHGPGAAGTQRRGR